MYCHVSCESQCIVGKQQLKYSTQYLLNTQQLLKQVKQPLITFTLTPISRQANNTAFRDKKLSFCQKDSQPYLTLIILDGLAK